MEFSDHLKRKPAIKKEIDNVLNSGIDDYEFEATSEDLLDYDYQGLRESTHIPPVEITGHGEVKENKVESKSNCTKDMMQGVEKVQTENKTEMSFEKTVDDDLTITPKMTLTSAEDFELVDCEEDIDDEDPFPMFDLTPYPLPTSLSFASTRKQLMQKSVSQVATEGNLWFTCPICEFTFTSQEKLIQHIDTHEITHECSECQIGFFSLKEALQHSCEEYAKQLNKNNENPDDLNSSSQSVMDEENDRGSSVDVPQETNEVEEITIGNEEEDKKQVRKKTPEDSSRKCAHCDTYFLNEVELREHEDVTHALGAMKDNLTGLAYKIPTESSSDVSEKSCKTLLGFQKHLRDQRKTNNNNNLLNVPANNVMKPPDKPCDICGKVYDSMIRLRRHMSDQHGTRNPSNIDPGKPGHVCDICGKSFPSYCRMRYHYYRTHSAKKTRKCECCGECFSTSDLNDHRRTHTGERPYKCTHCGNSYIQASNLKAHQRSKHNRMN